ncbi:TolC family protein [Elusimicrobiota bacterium]
MKGKISFLLAILLSCSILHSTEKTLDNVVLSMDKAVELALANSKDVEISKEKLEKLWNTYREVKASIFPQVYGEVGVTNYIEAPIMTFDIGNGPISIPVKQEWETRASVTLSQVLWAFGKVFNAIDIAKQAIKMEELSKEAVENYLIFGIKQTYYTLLFAEATVGIAKDSHKNALKNREALKERFRGGRISRVNNIKMEADISARVPAVLKAEATRNLIIVSLKDMLELNEKSKIELTDGFITKFPRFKFDELYQKMLANEPTIKIFRKGIDLNKSIIKLKKAGFLPTLSGFASYGYGGEGGEIYPEENMQRDIIAGVRLNLTLWDSGATWNAYKQAKNDKNIAIMEHEKKLKEMRVALSSTLLEYDSLIETYKANLKAQEYAEQAYDITLSSFKSGAVSQTMLNDAEIRLTAAKIESKTTLFNINILIAKIENMTGRKEEI